LVGFNIQIYFAECQNQDTRQSLCQDSISKFTLPSTMTRTLGKVYKKIKFWNSLPKLYRVLNKYIFAECRSRHSTNFALTETSITADKLCRVSVDALGKILCNFAECPEIKHSTKCLRRVRCCRAYFAECHDKKHSAKRLPSVMVIFAERIYTRQSRWFQ